ncbi:hypothetical protein D3C75_1247440 [compost metagenome]
MGQDERLVHGQEVGLYVERVGLQRAGHKECEEEQEDAHVFALADLNGAMLA